SILSALLFLLCGARRFPHLFPYTTLFRSRGAWLPVPVMPCAARELTSPFGICHSITPSLRSYAVICDHGGPIAESPLLCSMKSTGDVYGTKSGPAFGGVPTPNGPPPPGSATISCTRVGSSFETTYILPVT